MIHNDVPTTCTASLLTGWDVMHLTCDEPKLQVNARLKAVTDLINSGFKRDFAILHAFTTNEQNKEYGINEFLPLIGFKPVFTGEKVDNASQRHPETGALTLWVTSPKEYEEKLKAYKKELTDLKEIIDPPKRPDPNRQKYEPLLLSKLRKAGMVQDNTALDNSIASVALVDLDVLYMHLKVKYGLDIKKWTKKDDDDWAKITIRRLKQSHIDWKNELV